MKKHLLLYFFATILLFSCNHSEKKSSVALNNSLSDLKYEIKITGMTCTGCEETIQSAVNEIKGIKNIKASHTDGIAKIEFDSTLTDTNQIKDKINQTGYLVVAFLPEK
jgi:mercuric ion transport protein